jgi:hypothetical protein
MRSVFCPDFSDHFVRQFSTMTDTLLTYPPSALTPHIGVIVSNCAKK